MENRMKTSIYVAAEDLEIYEYERVFKKFMENSCYKKSVCRFQTFFVAKLSLDSTFLSFVAPSYVRHWAEPAAAAGHHAWLLWLKGG